MSSYVFLFAVVLIAAFSLAQLRNMLPEGIKKHRDNATLLALALLLYYGWTVGAFVRGGEGGGSPGVFSPQFMG